MFFVFKKVYLFFNEILTYVSSPSSSSDSAEDSTFSFDRSLSNSRSLKIHKITSEHFSALLHGYLPPHSTAYW